MRQWVDQESFWIIHAAGPGLHQATLEVPAGQFAVAVPLNMGSADNFTLSPDGKRIVWVTQPGEQVKALFLQLSPLDAPLGAGLLIDEKFQPGSVLVGSSETPVPPGSE